MYLATIRGVNQKTHIDQSIVETLRRLFVDDIIRIQRESHMSSLALRRNDRLVSHHHTV